jgi:ABC-type multidrug transport system fused ATPase/permease subunit
MNARGVSFSVDQFRSSVRIFLRLLPYARPHAANLSAAGMLTALIVLTDLARPWPIKVVIDQVILGQSWAALPSWLAADRSRLLLVACVTLLALAALGGALTYLRTTLLARAGQEVVNRLRRDLYARLLQLSLRYHDRHPRGDLLVRLTGDVSLIRMLVIEGAFLVGQEIVTLIGVLVVMLTRIAETVEDGTAKGRAHDLRAPAGARSHPARAHRSSADRRPGR